MKIQWIGAAGRRSTQQIRQVSVLHPTCGMSFACVKAILFFGN